MTGIIDGGIEIEQVLSASPEQVFAAWTEPSAFTRWFGGTEVDVPLESLDFIAEPERTWSARMVLPDGKEIGWAGEFLEVTPPSRVVMTITDQPQDLQRAKLAVTFTPADSGSVLYMTQETPGFSKGQQLATIAGWQGFLAVLAEIAETPATD